MTDTRRRVKVYTLNEDRQWDDRGTGHVSSGYVERLKGTSLLVRAESDGSLLLESKISPNTAYQKQQDTLIVWSEAENYDLALSFQEKAGCDEIWEKICQDDEKFLTDLFAQLTDEATDDDKRHELVNFLKEFCAFSQTLQPQNRDAFFKTLSNMGILPALEVILGMDDVHVRSAATDIFSYLVEYNPSMVREFVMQEAQQNDDDILLINLIIEHMICDTDPELGGAVQLMGLLRTLVDPENMLATANKTEKTEFLSFFYKHCMHVLTAPLLANTTEEKPSKGEATTHHGALRFMRKIIGLKDEFYNRYIMRNFLFEPVVKAFLNNGSRYNLMNSAIIEMFEYVRVVSGYCVVKVDLTHSELYCFWFKMSGLGKSGLCMSDFSFAGGKSMEEIKRLLLLILGCAVQCERKEEFIEKIKQLDIETQAAIVTHIQEVTHNQENVFDLQWLEMPYLPPEDLDSLSRNMVFHLRKLIDERDDSSENSPGIVCACRILVANFLIQKVRGKSMEEIKRLLLLILGCAVQCERKEEFIEKIKQLDIETQAAIVTHIQEVTHNQENVFDLQWLEMPYLPPEDLDSLSRNMVFHLRKLIDERDDSSEVIVELTQERDYLQSQQPLSPVKTSSPETTPGPVTLLSKEDRQHLAVELADCKAKLRRTRQELKYKILETKIESTLQKTLEIKEEKIQALESRLEESSSLNQQLRSELTSVKKNLEAMKQRQEEEAYHLNSAKISPEKQPPNRQNKEKWETEHRETTMELLKVKDRVIDTEKCNAALQAEKHLLKEQLKQLDSQNNLLNSQIVALQRQAASLQEHNTALQTQTAKLQVENSTLNSQSVSLMAQNAMLQSQQSSMETDAENVVKQKEELKAAHESLLLDHERFMTLHERQSVEYETLISQHGSLKMTHKALEHEYRDLDVRYGVLLRQKAAMEELEMALKSERENLAMEKQKSTLLLGENNNLKEEIDRFTFMHRQLQEEYDGLQLHTKELKTALNNSQLDLNRWQARYDELKEQHQNLDISLTKLDNHCELLNRLKGNLEEENHHLLSQIQMLSQQNQTLLERTMESKELYHEEQKQYMKNNWVGAKALVKLIKPKKDGSRERPKSTPESLAQPSDYPDGLPPLPPPPLPPRLSHLSLDNNLLGSHSLEENLNHTPTTRALNDSGVRLRGMYRSVGSNENMESPEAVARRRRMELGSMAYSTSAIHMSASSSTPIPGSRQTLRPKGFITDDDLRLQSFDAVFANSSNGNQAYRTNALDHCRNASNSSSPVSSKGSCDRIQGRSVNLSSDEVVSGHELATLPREGCLYHSGSAFISSSKQEPGQCVNGLASYDTPQKGAPSHPQGRARPSLGSPSGELVTLEEFLQESNNLSPPTVRKTKCLLQSLFNCLILVL
ncbi:UNVERIFIED_CONTAM: hypothetical protein FKN15_069959 [Acipenser sinensis]